MNTTLKLDELSEKEIVLIKGGKWIIIDGELYWVEERDIHQAMMKAQNLTYPETYLSNH